MKIYFNEPLLTSDSTEGLKELHLKDSQWTVNAYTLRGGLQEGVQVIEIDNGKLSFSIIPTRGMGIWKGQCGDISLGWDSPVKRPVNPAFINAQERGGLGWLKGFNEWIVRCGLNSMGAPCEDKALDNNGNEFTIPLTLHGNIANTPAHFVSLEVTDSYISVKGEVEEAMMFGPALRLATEIRTEIGSDEVTITDTVTNFGDNPAEHELLYHINYGQTLLEEGAQIKTAQKSVKPRDARSAEGMDTLETYEAPQAGFVEQAYFYELAGDKQSGETVVMLKNADGNRGSAVRFSLKDFPCFTLWKNTAGLADGYVTGLEPGTNYPNARPVERENGRIITLNGGESRKTKLSVSVLDSSEAVKLVEAEIESL